jgi:4-diphosphocytidyl-2-C-methyl-D-erythritol kinase
VNVTVYRALAPAKVNLGLFVGPTRAVDSRHELVSVMQSISLADELTLDTAPGDAEHDEVLCPGVPGPPQENLASAALAAFRQATGWAAPPVRLHIHKRIPIAAGLAGGSADAAATLRLARHASGLGDARLLSELGAALGADVPAQIAPGRWLASGAGEHLRELPAPGPFELLVVPAGVGLSTGAVFAQADTLARTRTSSELEALHASLARALAGGEPLPAPELLHNDLQQAAVSLCPQIASTLEQVTRAGGVAMVSGSGPTVVGLFAGGEHSALRAAQALGGRSPAPICATPVGSEFARPTSAAGERHAGASQSLGR